jgi:t-SNARE complex subunit (syntaxin)
MNSNRYGEARTAYREVQERHEDIKRIERTIAELAQLFNDVRVIFSPTNSQSLFLLLVLDEYTCRTAR